MEAPLSRDPDYPLYRVEEDDNGHLKLVRLIGMHDGEAIYEAYEVGQA